MTEATLSFRCVKGSQDLYCDLQGQESIHPSRLSLRGGFEMSAASKSSQGTGAKGKLMTFSFNRKKVAIARRRFVSSKKKATAAVEEPQVENNDTSSSSASKSSSKAKPMKDTVAGALARAASQSTIHPLDTVKVQMQAGTLGSGGVSKFGSLVPPSGASKIIPGIASLYRGVFGAASGAGIAIGAYFAIYSTTTRLMDHHVKPRFKNVSPGTIAFAAGAIAAAGGSFVKVPLAVCIRSVQAGVYPNVIRASRSIVKAAGPRGLFTGFLPTFLEDVPDMAVKFACYETLRNMHKKFNNGIPSTPQEDLVMGGFSGSVAAAATTPLDVIKTRMMCTAANRPSLFGACRSVIAEGHGVKAFFSGVGPRALSNGINTAVFFAFFEAIKHYMDERESGNRRRKNKRSGSTGSQMSTAQGGAQSNTNAYTFSEDEMLDLSQGAQMTPCVGALSQTAVTQHLDNQGKKA